MSIFLFWELATVACTVLLVLVAHIAARRPLPHGPEAEPASTGAPGRPALRLVMMSIVDAGIVLDGIVERGHVLGSPGMPVTVLLELTDLCALTPAVKELQRWAEANAVVEVTLFVDGGEPTAALRSGDEALQLPVLGVSS